MSDIEKYQAIRGKSICLTDNYRDYKRIAYNSLYLYSVFNSKSIIKIS